MTVQTQKLLSISIVSYLPEQGELKHAINSLLNALCESGTHFATITIIDNSESNLLRIDEFEELKDKLDEINCELRLLQGQGNVGYGAGHNLAIVKANTEFSLLMNSDIEVNPSALELGIKYLQNNKDVAAIGPSASYDSGEKQFLCKRYPTVFDFFLRGFMPKSVREIFRKRLSHFEMRDLSEEHPTKDIPIISGCFMLCRTEALQKVAGFNEDYFLYFEDFDFSMRLNELYTLAYLPSMKVVHHGGNSARKGIKHIKYFFQSGAKFFSTYGWRWI